MVRMVRLRCRFVQCCRDRFGTKTGNDATYVNAGGGGVNTGGWSGYNLLLHIHKCVCRYSPSSLFCSTYKVRVDAELLDPHTD